MTTSNRGYLFFMSQLAITAVIGIGSLYWGGRALIQGREQQRQAQIVAQRAASAERGNLFVARTDELKQALDPAHGIWETAAELAVPLQPQTIAMPMLVETTIDSVRLRGLTDGTRIAWRLDWPDTTSDMNVDTGRFTDAVALQFPITRHAAFSMGDRKQLVQILHWKGLWQKDVDEHFQDVQDLHPNYWTDLYWFTDEAFPQRVPESFDDPRSHAWFVAYEAANPMADFNRTRSVEELSAEGYGTLTSQLQSVTSGKGLWLDGRWSVVFVRPLRTEDPLDYQFWRGSRGEIGIAVWDGSSGNVGGRKHWSNWVEFEVSL